MKTSEVYTCYSDSKDVRYEIEEYDQPFWSWLKGVLFHRLICPTETRWTQWFWHLPLYHMGADRAPLCAWMDVQCYHLRNAKKSEVRQREITKEQYEAHK